MPRSPLDARRCGLFPSRPTGYDQQMRAGAWLFAMLVACTGDIGSTGDANPNSPDADPNDPDANPNDPDANPNDPDANPNDPDAAVGPQEFCPPLAPATGTTVTVSTGESIAAAVAGAESGTTVLVSPGTYDVSTDPIWINTSGITLRSLDGDRESVILDGDYYDNGSGGVINVRADDVTIASLSIRKSRFHAIHITGGDSANTMRTHIYDVSVLDPGEQAIKVNASGSGYYADDGEIACSRLELTRAGEAFVTSQVSSGSSCYTGGVDAHDAWGWVIRDNWIEGFWCSGSGQEYLSEHGVHFWTGSRDTIVERNRIVNNVRGIGFGLGPGGRSYTDSPCGATNNAGHYGGVIRNNFIVATDTDLFASGNGVQEGISLSSACDATVLHNTIVFTQDANSAIEWRFAETSAVIANNLATDRLWDRGVTVTLDSNLEEQPATGFENVSGYDLHLTAALTAAIDSGTNSYLDDCSEDIDGSARDDGSPDLGADEL